MVLTGPETERLVDALLDAFPTKGDLTRLVRVELGPRLDRIVNADAPLQDVAFDLIAWAEDKGELRKLVAGAVRQQPHNKLLIEAAALVQRSLSASEATVLPADPRTPPAGYRAIPGQDGYAFFCNRTPQWERVQAPAYEASSELVFVPGGFEQGHEYFLKRIKLRLVIDPRSVVDVSWPAAYAGPATRGEMLETLLTALRRSDGAAEGRVRRLRPASSADHLSAEIVERIASSLSQRNLMLLHGTLAMDFRETLVSYYTEWLPDILRQVKNASTTLRCFKCYQAVEWLSIPWFVRMRAALARGFSGSDLERGFGESDARSLIGAIVKRQAADVLSVRSVPDLHDISDQDLLDLCDSWALTDAQDRQRLVARCSVARTSSGKLRIVDAVLPYLLRRDVAAA